MARRPNLTPAQLDEIAELTEVNRLTVEQIARKIGCSKGSVHWAQLRIGADKHADRPLPPVPTERLEARRGDHLVRRFTASEDAELERLAKEGLTDSEIGRRLTPRRRPNSVRGRLMTLARRAAREEARTQGACQ